MSYVTLDEFKSYVRSEIQGADDTDLQESLDVADQMINTKCERTFTVAGEEASTRSYAPTRWSPVLSIHDATAVESVVENGVPLVVSTDFQLEPLPASHWSGETWPYEFVRRQLVNGWYQSDGTATVVVTAMWGWAAVPAAVKVAAKILAKDIIGHRDVKFGLVGVSDFGGIRARQASLVGEILAPYVRKWGGSASSDLTGAFSIDTVATCSIHADVCSLNFGALYCSCGAVLTGSFPLWEVGGEYPGDDGYR